MLQTLQTHVPVGAKKIRYMLTLRGLKSLGSTIPKWVEWIWPIVCLQCVLQDLGPRSGQSALYLIWWICLLQTLGYFIKKKELANGISAKKIQQLRSYKLQYGEKLIEENLLVQHQEIVEDDDEPPVKRTPGRPGAVPIPSEARRHHGNLHLPEVNDKQQRCRNVGCDKKSTIKCSECNVPLCLTSSRNCFKSFHV